MKPLCPWSIVAACLLSLSLSTAARADTGYYLVSTYDVEGQASVDYKYWNAHYNGRTVAAPEIGLSYGVTSRWYTELYGKFVKFNGGASHWVETNWQNDYMLTQGQYDVDVALHTRVARARDATQGYTIEWGPVLQTEIGRTQFNANVFFQHVYRAAPGTEHAMELTYQLQVKQRWKSWLQPGVQAFGEVGKWNDWLTYRQQSHRAGPALFGEVDIGAGGRQLKYEAAYLIGRNSARAAKSFAMRAQLVF